MVIHILVYKFTIPYRRSTVRVFLQTVPRCNPILRWTPSPITAPRPTWSIRTPSPLCPGSRNGVFLSVFCKIPGRCLTALEKSFFDLTHVAFWDGEEAENELKVSCDPLKHRFLVFTQVAFCVGQDEENEFPVPGDHLKHRFLDLTKVEFWAFQEAENDF